MKDKRGAQEKLCLHERSGVLGLAIVAVVATTSAVWAGEEGYPGQLIPSPTLSLTNATTFKTPLAVQPILGLGGPDSLVATGSRRNSELRIASPITIAGWNLRNSVRIFDQIRQERPLPQVLRTDNGPEFLGEAFTAWACAVRWPWR